MFVELEFSTSENLLVKKLRLEIKEDSQLSFYYKVPIISGLFFWLKITVLAENKTIPLFY
jgi:hypothetical protein